MLVNIEGWLDDEVVLVRLESWAGWDGASAIVALHRCPWDSLHFHVLEWVMGLNKVVSVEFHFSFVNNCLLCCSFTCALLVVLII